MTGYGFAIDPLVPLWLIGALALAAAPLTAWSLWRGRRGALLRALALALVLAALVNPQIRREERDPLPSVVAVVVDETASQSLGQRREETERIRAEVEARLERFPNIEIRWIRAQDTVSEESDGSELFRALRDGLADVPPERIAGAIMITDGQVHDVPAEAAGLGFRAPVHALITGREGERDRRIVLMTAPRFGIVGHTQTFVFRVEDVGAPPAARIATTVRRDGDVTDQRTVRSGEVVRVEVEVGHAGDNVVEIEVETLPGEITTTNNRVAATLKGVRENLRVLLISGEPHAGERTWRNLLKSDASVNLVHFTILRPPDKVDATPIRELSLIAFPVRELFQEKINEFDLIIFDRYERRGILPMIYFDNMARYVRNGGAILIASGPEDAGFDSVFQTPLSAVLPAEPRGTLLETPYHPRLSAQGQRHPVTRALPGSQEDPPRWSRWFRLVDADTRSGRVLMQGPAERPVLMLDRQEEGRVALFLTDHVWLWARGFEGGGPHTDILRRLVHWLMKEPDLEEEALRVRRVGRDLVIERQTMEDTIGPATVTTPTGQAREIVLGAGEPGVFRASIVATEPGIWRVAQGGKSVLTHVGPINPREFADPRSTTDVLAPLVQATGGTARRVASDAGLDVPRIVPVRSGDTFAGPGWIGLRPTEATVLKGIDAYSLFAGLLGLALLLGGLGLAWYRESR
jgi:hypothetical protein